MVNPRSRSSSLPKVLSCSAQYIPYLRQKMIEKKSIEAFRSFLAITEKFKLLPFKINKKKYFNMEVQVTKQIVTTMTFSITVIVYNVIISLVKDMLFNVETKFSKHDYLLAGYMCSIGFALIGFQVFTILKRKEVVTFLNQLFQFHENNFG